MIDNTTSKRFLQVSNYEDSQSIRIKIKFYGHKFTRTHLCVVALAVMIFGVVDLVVIIFWVVDSVIIFGLVYSVTIFGVFDMVVIDFWVVNSGLDNFVEVDFSAVDLALDIWIGVVE